jgi:hypothetical protein
MTEGKGTEGYIILSFTSPGIGRGGFVQKFAIYLTGRSKITMGNQFGTFLK